MTDDLGRVDLGRGESDDDPRVAQYARERAEAVELAHRAMLTSYIGGPPAGLRGDADRMVAALIKEGWTPPGDAVTESAMVGGKVFRRKVILVEDWREAFNLELKGVADALESVAGEPKAAEHAFGLRMAADMVRKLVR